MNPVRVDVTGQICAPELQPYLAGLRSQRNFPYVWPTPENRYSGKGLPGCMFPIGRDCSGTVEFALRGAGWNPEGVRRGDCSGHWQYERALAEGRVTERPQIGDLVVYVSPQGHGVHIESILEDGSFYGAIGAGSNCTTPEKAKELDARVKVREHPYPEAHGRAVFIRNPLRT
jgi:hypothetical protein